MLYAGVMTCFHDNNNVLHACEVSCQRCSLSGNVCTARFEKCLETKTKKYDQSHKSTMIRKRHVMNSMFGLFTVTVRDMSSTRCLVYSR